MAENFNIYDYGCSLNPGSEARIDVTLLNISNDYSGKIELLLDSLQPDEIRGKLEESKKREMDEYNTAKEYITNHWVEAAEKTALLEKAAEIINVTPVKHTNNHWDTDASSELAQISNNVYRMFIRVEQWDTYNYDLNKDVTHWYVTWEISTNSPIQASNMCIAGQSNKRFETKEAAQKYILGRKKAYAKYFTETNPAVPDKYLPAFKKYGVLLPGYKATRQN